MFEDSGGFSIVQLRFFGILDDSSGFDCDS